MEVGGVQELVYVFATVIVSLAILVAFGKWWER